MTNVASKISPMPPSTLPESFHAFRINQSSTGDIQADIETIGFTDLTPGDVTIEVMYSGINYKDALAATGRGQILKSFPLVGGIDCVGRVVHSEHAHTAIGDLVVVTGCGLSETQDGGYSEFVRVRHECVIPLPEQLTPWEAMCLGTAGFTAGLAIQKMEYNSQTPDKGPIVVTGATGGVGSLAINMLSGLGYEVVALTSKAQQKDYLTELGAKTVLLTQDIESNKTPMAQAKWAGAIDNVGGDVLTWLTQTTGWWGNIASIGLAGGHALNTSVMPFILRGINLLGINSMATPRTERLSVWRRLASDLKPKHLEHIGKQTIEFSDLANHFSALMDNQQVGRTVVSINPDA